jgi:hypothetical protein
MFKRLCSPATLIATLALFVALGGTGYSADALKGARRAFTARTPSVTPIGARTISKTEATHVFDSLIKHARVAYATTSGTATSAATATHATTADSATAAATATNAVNATHATSADTATLAAASSSIASVTYEVNPSAGPETVPACDANPCTAEDVESTPAIAVCPAGMVAIGGGGASPDSGVELSGSFPVSFGPSSTTPNAWEVYVDNFLPTPTTVDYYAICTTVKAIGG